MCVVVGVCVCVFARMCVCVRVLLWLCVSLGWTESLEPDGPDVLTAELQTHLPKEPHDAWLSPQSSSVSPQQHTRDRIAHTHTHANTRTYTHIDKHTDTHRHRDTGVCWGSPPYPVCLLLSLCSALWWLCIRTNTHTHTHTHTHTPKETEKSS